MILNDGNYDGSHHKQYALDQALRILAGERYDQVVKEWEKNGSEDPEDRCFWEIGKPA